MLATFGALAPVFLMIGLGRVLATRNFPGDEFWPAAERLVYWLLLPALLLVTTAGSDLTGLRVLPVVAALIAAILLTAGLALALRPLAGARRCRLQLGVPGRDPHQYLCRPGRRGRSLWRGRARADGRRRARGDHRGERAERDRADPSGRPAAGADRAGRGGAEPSDPRLPGRVHDQAATPS